MIILTLIQNIALLIALAATYQVIASRYEKRTLGRRIFSGILFGGVGLVGMMTPVDFAPGIIFDGRSIILSVSGLFGGPLVAAISAIICGTYRLWLGGAGAWEGVGVIVESAAVGTLFHFLWKGAENKITGLSLYFFGLLVHVVMPAMMLALPDGAGFDVIRRIGLPILLVYPFACMLVCRIFLDYERQILDKKALQASELRYRAIFENASVGIDLVNPDGRFLQVNNAFASMLGYDEEELQNMTFLDISYPDDLEVSRTKHERMVKGEEGSYSFEKRYIKKNGEILWADVSVSPVFGPQGSHTAAIAVITDITDRKNAEAALSASASRYRSLVELIPAITYTAALDDESTTTYISPQIESILGFTTAEYREDPDTWRKQIHHEDRDRVMAEVIRCHESGETFLQEYRMMSKGGDLVWIRDEAAIVRDQVGNPIYLQGIMFDITDRKEAEEALRKSREQLQTVFEASPAGIILVNPEGLITFANRRMGDLFCRPCEDLIGTPYLGLVHPSQGSIGNDNMTSLMKGDIDHVSLERRYQASSEREFRGHLSGRRILKEDGTLEGLVGIITDITDFRKAEAAVRESEERFRLAMEATSDGVWDWDLTTDTVFRSPGFFNMLGYEPDEFSRHFAEWHDLVHPDDLQQVRRVLKDYLLGIRETYEMEFRMFGKSGEPVWILSRGRVAARDQEGSPTRIIGTHTDITVRKEAEKQIRMNEARLQSLYDIGQYRATDTNDFLDFALNEAIKLCGGKAGYICGYDEEKRVFELYSCSKEVMQRCEIAEPPCLFELADTGLWGEAVRQRRPIIVNDFKSPNVLKKGYPEGHVELDNFLTIPVFAGDRIVAVVGVGNKDSDFQDADVRQLSVLMDSVWRISEAKRVEAAQRKLVTAVEQTVEGIVITDINGNVEYVNPAYENITGYSRDEIIGRTTDLFRSEEDDSATRQAIIDTIHRGDRWSGHLVNKRKEGGTYEEDVTITPVLDSQGNVVNFVMVKRDVTKEADLQRQLLQAQKMEAVGTLAGGVAHDFNNILQVVLGFSELLLGDKSLPKHCRSDMLKVHYSAKKGADLVQRLLTFSRKTEIKPQPLNLNRRIVELRKMLERTVPKMIDIRLELYDGLATINADPTQMDQILMNLALNSRDAMPDGGTLTIGTADIRLDEEYAHSHLEARPGPHVMLTVTDTGVGMDRETLEHIFEPFYTTKGVGEGTGLGLAMVHGIVTRHGGHIRCYSEPGVGTIFRIYFPAPAVEDVQEDVIMSIMPSGGSETILLADDEEFIRDLGARILSKAGYKVITASNGKEALEIFEKKSGEIDLVLLDLIMPEMGGRQCLEKLLSLDPSAKVVIASGYSADVVSQEALLSAAKNFINKPYDRRLMLKIVREALDAK